MRALTLTLATLLALFSVPAARATYPAVIDGFGSPSGAYQKDITTFTPCAIPCMYPYDFGLDGTTLSPPPIEWENEPPLVDGYQDAHNGGCNSPEFGHPFQWVWAPWLIFCGVSGWYLDPAGSPRRDTDWLRVDLGPVGGTVEIFGDAEHPTYLFELAPQDCGSVDVVQSVIIGPCQQNSLTVSGPPYSHVWIWVGPTTTTGPVNEYRYTLGFGVAPAAIGTVMIDPHPTSLAAPWHLQGPSGSVSGQGHASHHLSPGNVSLTWGDVAGWITPEPATVQGQVEQYGLVVFSATYLLDLPFAEDFTDGETPYFNVVSGNWAVSDGWYRCLNEAVGVRHLSQIGNDTWTDYRAGVDILTEGAIGQELVFRYQSPTAWYLYRVVPAPENSAALWKFNNGSIELLHAVSNVAHEAGEAHRLEVAAVGGTFRTYLNGTFLFEATDANDPWLAGGIALSTFAGAPGGWQLASFDNLQIAPEDAVSVAPLPAVTTLALAAAPNPFNPATVVRFALPRAGDVTIAVHDLRGRLVRTLHQGGVEAGRHEVTWDGRDGGGGAVASGVYLVRLLTADGEVQAVKITLAK